MQKVYAVMVTLSGATFMQQPAEEIKKMVGENPLEIATISQEGYDKLEKAQLFCLGREENIVKKTPFIFRGEKYTYIIKEVTII